MRASLKALKNQFVGIYFLWSNMIQIRFGQIRAHVRLNKLHKPVQYPSIRDYTIYL